MIHLFLLGLTLICFSSIGSRSLKSFSRHKLEDICRRRGVETRLPKILKEYDRVSLSAGMFRLVCSTGVVIAAVSALVHNGYLALKPWSEEKAFELEQWAVFLVAILFCLLLTEYWIPRTIAKLWGTYITYFTWPFWRGIAFLLHPLFLLDRFFSVVFHRLAGQVEQADEEEAFEDEIRTMVTEGHREGLLEEDAREMIEGVIELGDFIVSEIMTPRTDMISISNALSWDEMLNEVISCTHSRIPVHKDNRDDIIGVIHAKDLLKEMAVTVPEKRRPWTDLMKEPLFVPETKPVDTLLQEFQNSKPIQGNGTQDEERMQKAKGHLAIVLDEYGGVSGIVTLEDILEEIVGEILDEHDPVIETEDIREVEPHVFETLGKVRIDDLNEKLSIHLPEEEDYDTIAGFIFSTLGHVPEIGEEVDYEREGKRIRFTVLGATRRRIEKVRVECKPGE